MKKLLTTLLLLTGAGSGLAVAVLAESSLGFSECLHIDRY
jgi:hypothetical protein